MWRLHDADRGDKPDPGIQRSTQKIVDERRARLVAAVTPTAFRCALLDMTRAASEDVAALFC